MAQQLTHVNPGDLITAMQFNALIDVVNLSVVRIEALEAGALPSTGLAITQLIPDGPYRVGDTLEILGRNFQYSIGATRVFLNTTQVFNLLPTSTDSRLQFVIPSVPGVLEQGTTVELVILNQTESVSRQITLKPRLSALQGSVLVTWLDVDPATIIEDQPATFGYRIESRTNNRATWLISPVIDVATNAAAWTAALRVLDAGENEIPSRQIVDLNPGEQRNFYIRLAPVPDGTDGVSFGLSVTATADGISGPSGVQPFTVGTATVPPDTTITPNLIPDFSGGALVGSTLTVPGGQNRQVAVDATFTVAGTYNITRPISAGTTGWTATPVIGTVESVPVTAADLAATGSITKRFRYIIAATSTATATGGRIEFSLQRSGETSSRSITLNLVRS